MKEAQPAPNPSGLCLCGCGQPTRIAPETDLNKGWVRGQPILYIYRHRRPPIEHTYRVENRDYVTPCWIWQGSTAKNGYGALPGGRRAHRVFYEERHGPIPPGLEPDHLCRQKACVNPDHIELVDHTENMRRAKDVKLTMEKAREIRRLVAGGMRQAEVARRFGILAASVSLVVRNKQWKERATDTLTA